MSTVAEVLTAHHAGLVVFAFSLITNLCVMTYDDTHEPNHSEVRPSFQKQNPTRLSSVSQKVFGHKYRICSNPMY